MKTQTNAKEQLHAVINIAFDKADTKAPLQPYTSADTNAPLQP